MAQAVDTSSVAVVLPPHPPPYKNKLKKLPLFVFFNDLRNVLKWDSLGQEILRIAFPAALALAADPVASLIDTAFIGHLGPVELAAVGVSIAIFNQASRITIFPLVSITTSFVAQEDTANKITEGKCGPKDVEKGSDDDDDDDEEEEEEEEQEEETETETETEDDKKLENGELVPAVTDPTKNDDLFKTAGKEKEVVIKKQKKNIPSASTALACALFLGLLQAMLLVFAAKPLLQIMGIKSNSPMMKPARQYLTVRSLGSPGVLLSLSVQGVFRGFKDTKTPLLATVIGDATNIVLDPIFIFVLKMGVKGAAIAHVLSQFLIAFILLLTLSKQVNLLPPSFKQLQFNRFLKNGIPLLARVIATTFCVTFSASMAARLGSIPMAAFQTCLQVWMTSSLLADGLAVAGQAILACAFAEKDYKKVTATAARVLQMAFVLGLGLTLTVGLGFYFGSGIFTKDPNVIHLITIGVPFVAATQSINSLAFVFDGVIYGASDFAYAGYSMVMVGIVTAVLIFFLAKSNGFIGIWIALTIFMFLRTFTGTWRMATGTGPWRYLRH